MAFGAKTNERPGTRAQARYIRMSPSKAREVLDLIRGKTVSEANELLALVERDAADVVAKVLASAVANAEANDDQDPERLFVSACYADEGPTLKRFRPRARGRATTIRKRTCHITVIVARMSEAQIAEAEAAEASGGGARQRRVSASRAARVAKSRQQDAAKAGLDADAGADAGTDTGADEATDAVETTDEVATAETADDADVVETTDEVDADASSDDPDTGEVDADDDTDAAAEAESDEQPEAKETE